MRRRLTPAPTWAAAVLAVAVLVLVTLAALASRTVPGRESREPPFTVAVDWYTVGRIVAVLLAGIVVLLLIVMLWPGGPKVEWPERKRWSPLMMIITIALLVAIITVLRSSTGLPGDAPTGAGAEPPTEMVEVLPPQQSGSYWGLLVLVGAVVLVLWGVVAATRSSTESTEDTEAPAPMPAVVAVIDAMLEDLESSRDPREVVIGAYARMEQALTADGLPRCPSEAPLEYLARALGRLRVSGAAVEQLTALFQVARFSDHEIDSGMARRAVTALNAIRAELSEVVL